MRSHGFTAADAAYEVHMITQQLGLENFIESMSSGGKFENDSYVRMPRKGAKIALDRKRRIDIAMTLNKAVEHASFEVYGPDS